MAYIARHRTLVAFIAAAALAAAWTLIYGQPERLVHPALFALAIYVGMTLAEKRTPHA